MDIPHPGFTFLRWPGDKKLPGLNLPVSGFRFPSGFHYKLNSP